jgi:hypothetical protein
LIARRQKTGAPIQWPALDTLAVAKDYVTGKILAFTPKPVSDPGASAGKTGASDTGVDLIKRGHVIVGFGVERFDEPKIIDVFGDIWILLANPRARLAVLLEAEWRLHKRTGISIEHVDVDSLSVAFGEFRFGVEEVDGAGRTLHEKPNN